MNRGHSKALGCFTTGVSLTSIEQGAHVNRIKAVRAAEKLWPNGSVIRYFVSSTCEVGAHIDEQQRAVRFAFQSWQQIGIGLSFKETTHREFSQVRIGFLNQGTWSAVGRDCLLIGIDEHTMVRAGSSIILRPATVLSA
jgi:hypothetical protein